jgi:hypothetical protein
MSKLQQNLLLIWGLLALAWAIYVRAQPGSVAVLFIIPPAILFFAGWGLTRLWEVYGKVYWLRLPLHLRRGLLRLYIAASVPWIAFFGYRFLDALQRPLYQRHTAGEAFWSLLIVPVGGPIALLVLMWVLAGFRKSEQTANEPAPGAKVNARSAQSQPKQSPTDTRNAKGPHDYTEVGKALGRIFFEPDIWHEMSKLQGGLIGRETAYARIAIVKDAIRRLQPHSIAIQMLAGVDQYVAGAFKKPAEATTATLAIRLYEQNVSPLTQLAEVLARRLFDSGVTAVEIAPLFELVAKEAEQLMKVPSAIQKFGEQGELFRSHLAKLSGQAGNREPRQ